MTDAERNAVLEDVLANGRKNLESAPDAREDWWLGYAAALDDVARLKRPLPPVCPCGRDWEHDKGAACHPPPREMASVDNGLLPAPRLK